MSRKKRITIMWIPHWGSSPRNFNVSLGLLASVAALVLAVATGLGILGRDYIHMQAKLDDLHRLEKVKNIQEAQLEQFARESREMDQELEEIKEMDREVRELLEMEEFQEEKLEELEEDGGRQVGSGTLTSRGSLGIQGYSLKEKEAAGDNYNYLGYGSQGLEEMNSIRSSLPSTRVSLEELENLLKEEKSRRAGTPSIWPLEGRLTSPYGYRACPFTGRRTFHQGIDVGAPRGTSIYAAADGVIEMARYNGGMGKTIIIDHPYVHKTLYAHLIDYKVKEGEEVKKGDVIGFVGSTGFSTGPHLHYEVHREGEPVDPMEYLPKKNRES